MRPRIGITVSLLDGPSCHQLPSNYVSSVLGAGGIPLLLPIFDDPDLALDILSTLDGLLLSGGVDVDPLLFGAEPQPRLGAVSPERDLADLCLSRKALEMGMPVLGICRGIQVMAVAAGGSIIQDIGGIPGVLKHRQESPRWHGSHTVDVDGTGLVCQLVGQSGTMDVNSFHHQALDGVPDGFTATAYAPDGIIEAIEGPDPDRFAVGVQWHPEGMVGRHPGQWGLFRGLVEAGRRWAVNRDG